MRRVECRDVSSSVNDRDGSSTVVIIAPWHVSSRARARSLVERSLARDNFVSRTPIVVTSLLLDLANFAREHRRERNPLDDTACRRRRRGRISRTVRVAQPYDARCVQQQFRRRFLGRNCRHRRPINITTSIVAVLHSPRLSCTGP